MKIFFPIPRMLQRKHCARTLAALIGILSLQVSGMAAQTPSSKPASAEPAQKFSVFQSIIDRNIFNQNRRTRSAPPPSRAEAPRPVRIESFSLAGTMITPEKSLAFFQGSDSKYRQVLKPGQSIGGFKLLSIDYDRVKLTSETQEFELPIQGALRKQDDEDWRLLAGAEAAESSRGRGSEESSRPASTSGPASSDGNAAEDEILKRLMQKREQELQR